MIEALVRSNIHLLHTDESSMKCAKRLQLSDVCRA